MKKYRFVKEDGKWYIDIPEWTGNKADLEMVMGADTMLDFVSQGKDETYISMSDQPFAVSVMNELDTDAFKLVKIEDTPEYGGATYRLSEWYGTNHGAEMWLCDVVRFVFGGYLPETIYIG